MRERGRLALLGLMLLPALCGARNVIVFVADGLRPSSVNAQDTPTLAAFRDRGVYFSNSHSVFPTVTMANSAAIATGHQPGDTGVYVNNPWIGYSSFDGGAFGRTTGSPTPFIENDQVLADVNDHYGGNLLAERTLLAAARTAGFGTAAIGKLGPVGMQDVTQLAPQATAFAAPQTAFVDDATAPDSLALPADVSAAMRALRLPATTSPRLQPTGDYQTPGTSNANWGQQTYFVDSATGAVLPSLKNRHEPFVLVYWSRDPDGTQHNQGDSLNALWPGINGDTARLGVQNADHNLHALLEWLARNPRIAADTDVFVTSDHGFATISKRAVDSDFNSSNSPSARALYAEVPPGFLPPGFLALDLATELDEPLYDPDHVIRNGRGNAVYFRILPGDQHSSQGSAVIGGDGAVDGASSARLIVAANGGSDVLYLPKEDPELVRKVVSLLATRDYVGGVFVHDRYGAIRGTLPLSAANLQGGGKLPAPDLIVNFRSFALLPKDAEGTADPLRRVVQISDTPLQQGQGMHGGFGRESTFNFMAAQGPDFRAHYVDALPVSNADIAPTLAPLLGVSLTEHGALTGRNLVEATHAVTAGVVQQCVLLSEPVADGRRTVLDYQVYEGRRYLDRAEFRAAKPGETSRCTEAPGKKR